MSKLYILRNHKENNEYSKKKMMDKLCMFHFQIYFKFHLQYEMGYIFDVNHKDSDLSDYDSDLDQDMTIQIQIIRIQIQFKTMTIQT